MSIRSLFEIVNTFEVTLLVFSPQMLFTTGSNKCRLAEFSIHDGQKGTSSIAAVRVENKSKLVLCRQTGSSGPIFIPSAFSTIRWLSSEDRGPSFDRQWIINARGTGGGDLICGSTSITRCCDSHAPVRPSNTPIPRLSAPMRLESSHWWCRICMNFPFDKIRNLVIAHLQYIHVHTLYHFEQNQN